MCLGEVKALLKSFDMSIDSCCDGAAVYDLRVCILYRCRLRAIKIITSTVTKSCTKTTHQLQPAI